MRMTSFSELCSYKLRHITCACFMQKNMWVLLLFKFQPLLEKYGDWNGVCCLLLNIKANGEHWDITRVKKLHAAGMRFFYFKVSWEHCVKREENKGRNNASCWYYTITLKIWNLWEVLTEELKYRNRICVENDEKERRRKRDQNGRRQLQVR